MSPRSRVFKPAELISALERNGFYRAGQKGSHVKFRNSAGVTIVIPNHPGHDIASGLALAILKRAGIDPASV